MRLLERFSGTGSVGDAFRATGWNVTSLDCDLRSEADLKMDVLDFPYESYRPECFEAIWASPPCTEYSIARTTARTPRNLPLADALVARTLEIIEHLKPKVWWIENPATGLLKSRAVIQHLPPPLFCDYCMYGKPYRKRTALWTNIPASRAGLFTCNKACGSWQDGHHVQTAQRGPGRLQQRLGINDRCTLSYLHGLPPALCFALEAATRAFVNSSSSSASADGVGFDPPALRFTN